MESITKLINEKCLIAILKADKRVVIYKNNCAQMVQANTPDEKKAYDSSTGRLLVAMLSEESLAKFIEQYQLPSKAIWQDANTYEKFMEQIKLIRKYKYALIEDSVQVIGIADHIYEK
jgi:DNA-binding IclR family transcriptional regulator